MPRLAQDVIVVSKPVRTYPNGDYFYIELSRKHNRYDCLLKMARDGNPPLWTVSLYLRLPWLWPVLGRQFFVVGVKP